MSCLLRRPPPDSRTITQTGYGKVLLHVVIGLKTVKGTKQLRLDPSIYDNLQKEKVGGGRTRLCNVPSTRR